MERVACLLNLGTFEVARLAGVGPYSTSARQRDDHLQVLRDEQAGV